MSNNENSWFHPFIEELESKGTDIVFVVDKIGVDKFKELESLLKKKYNGMEAQSEIEMRKAIKEKGVTTIIINNQNSIPHDLESRNSVIRLDYGHFFPRLNEEAVREFMEDKDESEILVIYEEYNEKFKNIYQNLNRQETKEFLEEALSEENYLRAKLKSIKGEFQSKKKYKLDEEQINQLSCLVGRFDYLKHRNNLKEETLEDREILTREIIRFIKNDYEDLTFKTTNCPLNYKIVDKKFQKDSKNALLCIDGMGYEEWNIIKEYLQGDYSINEGFSISMLPPITSYSRLSIFSGKTPKELRKKNNLNLNKEGKLFKEKISEKTGTLKEDIGYFKEKIPANLGSYLHYNQIGFVFTFVDKISHNASDEEILIKSIENELEKSNLKKILGKLLENNFNVIICSDHGGLFAEGVGKFINKDLVEDRAKRALVYRSKDLANESESEYTEIFDDLHRTFGDKALTMFKSNKMLEGKGEREHTHGGISLKELFLPLVEVNEN